MLWPVADAGGVSEQKTDLLLVRRVQAGEKAAFDLLVLRYQHKVANLVSRFVHDHSEVQDVTQEAFIKAYRSIEGFRGDSAFYTWLYRIAVNTSKNYLAARARRPMSKLVSNEDAEQFESAGALRENADPASEAATDELARVIRETIRNLPDELRTAITLRELKGLTYEEIAQVMECPVGTVRSRIFRAREAIDQQLKPLLDETGKY